MSLNIVSNFLDNIFDALSTSVDIINLIPRVYLSPPQTPNYPFLLINLEKVIDQNQNFAIEFDIYIFYREQPLQVGIELSDKIDNCLLKLKNHNSAFKTLGIKQQNITISRSEDTLTSKISIKYLSLIRKI